METTIRISPDELTPAWIKKIKTLFENEEKLEIIIRPLQGNSAVTAESREEYITRINNAIRNLDQDNGTITLTRDEFEKLTENL